MIQALTKTTYTPEDLLAMPDGKSYELVDGQLVERNVSVLSSRVGGKLYSRVDRFCEENDLGEAWPADNGIQCFPDRPSKVRKPDVALVRKGRLPANLYAQGFLRVVPDLVAEVISPNDVAWELDEKITEYQGIGVRLVWIVNPEIRTIRVYRLNGPSFVLREHQELDGEDVLPGFRCRVGDLFPPAELVPPTPPKNED